MNFRPLLASTYITLLAVGGAAAETRVEKKLMQFGGPETRTRCINNLKTKGIPACRISGWEVTCEDRWIIACTEWATDFYQHEIFLVVTGPDAEQALRKTLENAISKSLAVALGAAVATPGEVAIKTAAAVAAFKTAFAAELAIEPALSAMRDQFKLSIQEKGHW
jgi:hypothetical protein